MHICCFFICKCPSLAIGFPLCIHILANLVSLSGFVPQKCWIDMHYR